MGKIRRGGGAILGHTQNQSQTFLAEIEKTNHKLSKDFYFIKISYVKAEFIELFGKKG